jgi:hypothetical protein
MTPMRCCISEKPKIRPRQRPRIMSWRPPTCLPTLTCITPQRGALSLSADTKALAQAERLRRLSSLSGSSGVRVSV